MISTATPRCSTGPKALEATPRSPKTFCASDKATKGFGRTVSLGNTTLTTNNLYFGQSPEGKTAFTQAVPENTPHRYDLMYLQPTLHGKHIAERLRAPQPVSPPANTQPLEGTGNPIYRALWSNVQNRHSFGPFSIPERNALMVSQV